MILENIKADLHAHGWCGQEEGPGQIVMKTLGETGERNLQTITEIGFFQDQHTLIGLINFGDRRYQKIVNSRGKLGKGFNIYDDHKERFIGVYSKEKDLWSYILRGQEIPTNEGHLLVLGNNKEITYRKIKDVLKEAEEMNALRIGDHPLAQDFLSKFFGFLTNQRMSLGKENVRKYKEYLDLLEYCNSNIPELTSDTETLGKEVNLEGVSCSDSHTLNQIFSSYMIFHELNFKNWYMLKESLLDRINNEKVVHYRGSNRKFENVFHGLAVLYNIARQKIGLVKNPVIEIE